MITHRAAILITSLALAVLTGCTAPDNQPQTEFILFAASSLTNVFDDLSVQFEAENPHVRVIKNYGSSAQLAVQLIEGAPADIFASANPLQMSRVAEAGLVDGEPLIFASNSLTLIVPASNPAGIQSLSDLAQPGVRILMAIPGTPVRDYADQMLAQLSGQPDYLEDVYGNLVSEEANVRRVVAKVILGEADVGIVYQTDITPDIQDDLLQIKIPDDVNITAIYPVAIMTGSQSPELAQSFIDLLQSERGQAILSKWGFHPAP